jgi:hypothetical protein
MAGSAGSLVEIILKDPDEDSRLDRLSEMVYKARQAQFHPTEEDARVLQAALRKETDRLLFVCMWNLLEYAPAQDEAKELAGRVLAEPEALGRGHALVYLLQNYPEERDRLETEYNQDEDPQVQDALARFLALSRPRDALTHWIRVLESPNLTHELSETTPFFIASVAERSDLGRFEKMAREHGTRSLWGITAELIRQK